MDASSSIAAQQASSSSSSIAGAAAVSNSTSKLDALPNELLKLIWIHLDDPTSFAITNKRLRAISQDTLWRAKWFMQRYATFEVLFHAIARIKVFTQPLLQVLLRFGAPLSRNLVQLLRLVRDFDSLKEYDCGCILGFKWGEISSRTFDMIERHAESLYGDEIPREPRQYDSIVFSKWIMNEEAIVEDGWDPEPSEQVRRLFREFNFMPLPLVLWPSDESCIGVEPHRSNTLSVRLRDAICFDLVLWEASLTNGLDESQEQRQQVLDTFLSNSNLLEARKDFWTTIERLLNDDGILHISRQYAKDAIIEKSSGFSSSPGYIGSLFVQDMYHSSNEDEQERHHKYDCLLYFDRKSALPFKLQDVIEDVFESQARDGSVTSVMIPFLDEINEDFSGWSRITLLFVLATFLKAEMQSVEDVDEVKRMMGRHEVTSASIMQACLRNGCRSVTPIRYALKYVEGFRANLQAFIEELLDALLYQPYRGIMLRELDRFFAQQEAGSFDFLKLLAAAVEDQAFKTDDLNSAKRNMTSFDFVLRSMLGFSFQHQNARRAELCGCGSQKARQQIVILEGEEPPRRLSYCWHPLEHFPSTTRTPWLQAFLRFGGSTLPAAIVASPGTYSTCNSLLGCIYEDDQHVAEVVVDLLGPRSRAANVLLSHALLNGNQPLVGHLLQRDVALTLEHFKVAIKVHRLFPEVLLEHIKRGLPFRSSHEELHQQPSNNDADAALLDLDVNSSASICTHVEQWINELASLEGQQVPSALAINSRPVWSILCYSYTGEPLGVVLSDGVRHLKQHLQKLRRKTSPAGAQQSEVVSSLLPLFEEMREAGADDSFHSDVRERVIGMLHGHKHTRSDKRSAFKQSPYSYKPIGFRGRFVIRQGYGNNETKTHEPQLAPLSDEDSADEDFKPSLESSDDEWSDTSGSDSELEDGDGSSEPPLKRIKGNNGQATAIGSGSN